MSHINKYKIIFLSALISFSLFACSSAKDSAAYDDESYPATDSAAEEEYYQETEANEESVPAEPASESSATTSSTSSLPPTTNTSIDWSQHKIIRTANLELETLHFTEVLETITNKASSMGGYIETSDVRGRKPVTWDEPGRKATMSLRIPGNSLELFLSQTRGMATILHESMQSDNVTSKYVDSEARKVSLQVQLKSVEEIMSKATKLEDILHLEDELARLRYEIENIESQLRSWDNLSSLSTVNISLFEINDIEKPEEIIEEEPEPAFGAKISESFKNGFAITAAFFSNLLIFLAAISPILIIAAIVLIIVLKRRKKMKANDKQKKQADSGNGDNTNDNTDQE